MHRYLLSTSPASMPRAAASRCWRAIDAAHEPTELLRRADIVLFADEDAGDRLHQDERGFCYLPAQRPHSRTGAGALSPASVLTAVRSRGTAALSDLLAPFAALLQTEPRSPVLVATDQHGLQHVYAHAGRERVLVSGSCLLLAAVADADLDQDAVLTFLRIGQYLGADSPFRGVDKLLGGQVWQIADHQRTTSPVPRPDEPDLTGAACLRASVHTLLAAAPDALVELSGGLDSRLIVGALGADACRGRRALTLGSPDAADVQIARRIARDLDMDWQFVDLGGIRELADQELLALVRRASLRCDHTTQPFARAVLEWVNAQVPKQARFSGQNGEIARGFFHPGFADQPTVDESLIARLLHWRLGSNDCIDRDLIDAEAWRQHEARLLRRLLETLRSYGQPWLGATDEFYLRERMQRWVGTAYSAETQDHPILAPFFDPRFVAWARRLPVADRRDSRAMARLVGELSPPLANIPLAGGLPPRVLGSSGLLARTRRRAQFVHKVLRKVRQRLVGSRRAPVGAPELARRLLHGGACGPEAFPRTAALGWIHGTAIGAVLQRGAASWSSIGQLLALEWTLDSLARARGR